MSLRKSQSIIALVLVAGILVYVNQSRAQKMAHTFVPVIPKVWDDEEMASLHLPLADPAMVPKQVSAEYYYSIPVRPIYKSYPVYAVDHEPAAYFEQLKQLEPETALDVSQLKTEADWTRAGEIVFEAPISYDAVVTAAQVRNPQWSKRLAIPATKDGVLPWFRYVVREKGKVELGTISCAMCHTRVLPDGTTVKGAQGNFPFEQATVLYARDRMPIEVLRRFERSFFAVPWLTPDPLAGVETVSFDQLASWHNAIPAGVLARQGTTPFYPTQISDLIGVRERKYLDHTGLQLQRSIVDLMRYSALNQGADNLASFNGFIPAARDFHTQPAAATQRRYSDEQLYALSLYIYSLTAPENPNKFDRLAKRGQKVFEHEGCAGCHTPPLYTNNKLTPVDGFKVPDDHREKYDVLWASVGTDPRLALMARRGTGYYKVPSLKGVWYRGPFEHNGSVATLEDWFDSSRLKDDYVPTGFRGAGVTTRPVKGHPFGLDLSASDKQALIAFLKTL